MKLSINHSIVNKNEYNAHLSKGYEPFDLTPQQLADHVRQGYAFSFQFKDSYRKADNFLCTDFIAADIDDGLTLDEALSNEFIVNNACLVYTTASHTPELHKFRVIFQTPRTLTDREAVRAAQRGLVRKLQADPAATDPARQFYGSRDCEVHLLNNVLTEAELTDLIELGKQPINKPDSPNKRLYAGSQADLRLTHDQEVITAAGETKRLAEMDKSQPIFCPFHQDKKPSAFTTQSRQGVMGIHCCACQLTFWPKGRTPPAYDFFAFDKLTEERVAQPPELWTHESETFDVEIPNPNRIFSLRYLPDIEPFDGITLIKSPKGSGKTEYLVRLVDKCKQERLSVLLVGHRRALLRSLATRLGLAYYLDTPPGSVAAKHYAICMDSLSTKLDPALHRYQVILIDESEQVFSHLLAETMNNDTRRRSYLLLQHYIRSARQVVALDADLNEVTMHAIQRFSEKNPFLDRRFILNRFTGPTKSVDLYDDDKHLIDDLFIDIAAGKRLFVCCNTKKRVEVLTYALVEKFGDTLPLLSITSATTDGDDAKAFVAAPAEEALKYRIILVSPAVGTGIDITFKDNASLIDTVYGIFQPLINTHYDVDQQLSRVRHPGSVRIWITPQHFAFETETDPILQELATSGLFPQMLTGYTRKGVPEFNWSDPFMVLYSHILSSQRASKNNLKSNFIRLRAYNGWNVTEVKRDKLAAARGQEISTKGRDQRFKAMADAMLAVAPLDPDEVDQLLEMREREQRLTTEQQHALDRYFLERFYHQPVSAVLLAQDNDGHYRQRLEMLEQMLSYSPQDLKTVSTEAPSRLLYELLHIAGIVAKPRAINDKVVLRTNGLEKFAAYCEDNKAHIERVFKERIDIRRDVRSKPILQLNNFLKACGLEAKRSRTISTARGKTYEYQLAPGPLTVALDILERRRHYRKKSEKKDMKTITI